MSINNKYLVLLLFSNNFTGIMTGLVAGIVDDLYFICSVSQKLKEPSLYCYM